MNTATNKTLGNQLRTNWHTSGMLAFRISSCEVLPRPRYFRFCDKSREFGKGTHIVQIIIIIVIIIITKIIVIINGNNEKIRKNTVDFMRKKVLVYFFFRSLLDI